MTNSQDTGAVPSVAKPDTAIVAEKLVFMRGGNSFKPAAFDSANLYDMLPIGTYTVLTSPQGLFLEKIEDFALEGKIYGDVDTKARRILNTFESRPAATGALFSGPKGCGKTMLTKRVSELAREQGIITIVINQPLAGESFNSFLQNIRQPCIVLFDEFEKVYDRDQQQHLLTIFDGVYSSKKLFLLTCNDAFKVNTFMHNRPGRIYYALEFNGLGSEFITEYCQDNLLNKDNIAGVVKVSAFFSEFSFDQLKALVEEMNRYNETAGESMKVLNLKPMSDDTYGTYKLTILRTGEPIVARHISETTFKRSPLSMNGINISIYPWDEEDEARPANGITEHEHYTLDTSRLKEVEVDKGLFVFSTHRNDTVLSFKREAYKRLDLDYDAY